MTLGLKNLLPHYVHRLGMEVGWAGKVGAILHLLNAIILIVTVVFRASPSSQQWAYATSVLVLRRAGLLFEAFPDGLQLDAEEFAASLGVGHRGGVNSHLVRPFTRLDRFSIAAWDPEAGTLAVPTQLRPVPDRWLRRLPESTRAVHASMVSTLATTALRTEAPVVTHAPALGMGHGR